VVSGFMTANKKQEQKMIINKGTTEAKIQKSKLCVELNIRIDNNYKLFESDSSMKPDQQEENLKGIPNVDEGLLTEVDEAKVKPETKLVLPQVHNELSEEEETQSVQPMQQALAAENTSVDAEEIVSHDTVQDQHQAQDPGCQRAQDSHSNPVPSQQTVILSLTTHTVNLSLKMKPKTKSWLQKPSKSSLHSQIW
jgi:hypothetical protein